MNRGYGLLEQPPRLLPYDPMGDPDRRAEIEALRAMPYSAYLNTPHWDKIRRRVIRRAGGKCEQCGSAEPLHVHHITYARLGYERTVDLAAICAPCHSGEHPDKPIMSAERQRPLMGDPDARDAPCRGIIANELRRPSNGTDTRV